MWSVKRCESRTVGSKYQLSPMPYVTYFNPWSIFIVLIMVLGLLKYNMVSILFLEVSNLNIGGI